MALHRRLVLGMGMGMGMGVGACGVLAGGGAWLAAPAQSQAAPRKIPITARKFTFSETEVFAHVGEAIVIEVTSLDFVHGFAIPQLEARIDAPPGRTVGLALRPQRAGRYTFLCDNFCGEAHDRMTGTLVIGQAADRRRA